MKYEAGKKIFICISGFENIDEECVKVPTNKRWVRDLKRFVCIDNYYEIEDESCQRLGQNEQYLASERKIACRN